ncbi:hypothetical protein HPSA50_1416 [Helicobacter pylori SouthAfrica50]|uniref:Uncharacterized protein n=1 Tax=Helicobacter pylori SouthAfrica50 TaxID=1352357 RepID=T2SCA2_HELPX|nr:hypothetical protein HPSA50_1416 [Helicobacter pylori SouthAfrica50]
MHVHFKTPLSVFDILFTPLKQILIFIKKIFYFIFVIIEAIFIFKEVSHGTSRDNAKTRRA